VGIAEESWSKKGGMDDTSEVYGADGVSYADLLQGNAIMTYSGSGYSYAAEKAGTTRGWSFTAWEELWNYGFPQEFEHFIDCVANDKEPLETGEDGQAVLEIIMAAYASAGEGRRIDLPFEPKVQRPLTLRRSENQEANDFSNHRGSFACGGSCGGAPHGGHRGGVFWAAQGSIFVSGTMKRPKAPGLSGPGWRRMDPGR
jgi:hypothetical protein